MSTITVAYSNMPEIYTKEDLNLGWFLYKGIPILKLATGECLYIRDLGSSKVFDYYPYQIKNNVQLDAMLTLDSTTIDTTVSNVSLKNQNYSVIALDSGEDIILAIRMYDFIYSLQDGAYIGDYNPSATYEKATSFELSFVGKLPAEG